MVVMMGLTPTFVFAEDFVDPFFPEEKIIGPQEKPSDDLPKIVSEDIKGIDDFSPEKVTPEEGYHYERDSNGRLLLVSPPQKVDGHSGLSLDGDALVVPEYPLPKELEEQKKTDAQKSAKTPVKPKSPSDPVDPNIN